AVLRLSPDPRAVLSPARRAAVPPRAGDRAAPAAPAGAAPAAAPAGLAAAAPAAGRGGAAPRRTHGADRAGGGQLRPAGRGPDGHDRAGLAAGTAAPGPVAASSSPRGDERP